MANPRPWLKPAVITGALLPLAAIGLRAAANDLGANPISTALNRLGLLALVFLVLTLACTPLKIVLGWTWPLRVRRELGLLAFFYASLHLLTYVVLDQGIDVAAFVDDVAKRPFILVGFVTWCLLVPLAVTSTDKSPRKLGFKRWKKLHRLTYVCAALGVLHFILRVKADLTEPLLYAGALGLLMLARVYDALPSKRVEGKRV